MISDEKTTRGEPTFWAAPDLAKAGYPVFPVGPDKTPSVAGGFYAATRDLSQIAEWITEGRENHDIAFPTGLVSLVVVVDADAATTYEKMHARYGEPHARTKTRWTLVLQTPARRQGYQPRDLAWIGL